MKHYGYKTALPVPLDKQQVADIARFQAREQLRLCSAPLSEKIDRVDSNVDDVNARLIAMSVRIRALEARAHEHLWTKLARNIKELCEIYKGI